MLFRRARVPGTPGCVPRFRPRLRHVVKTGSHLGASGLFASRSGHTARHRALANSGAQRRRGRRRVGPAFVRSRESFRHRARLAWCGKPRRLGSPQSVAIAPLCGCVECRGPVGHFEAYVALSRGCITRLHLTAPRDVLFHMQPAVNGCSVLGIVTARLIAHVPRGSASFTTG